MVCKEDVLSWFKELESYKRIDFMCSLLNMCLPFELRFAGTYVEELGRRDYQELRGAELRANNPEELAADVGGAGADPRAPRRMALYVSLLRSCNAACAATLHAVLRSLPPRAPLDELLLLYCLALHHPAFTFHQRQHFGDILARLQPPQGAPAAGEQINEIANTTVTTPNTQPINEPLMSELPEAVPPPPTYTHQYSAIDYGMQGHWPEVMPEMIPPEAFSMYPSPTISMPSSPGHSRPATPNTQVPPPPLVPRPRVTPRQTQDTISMPPPPTHESHHLQQHQLMANFNNMNINETRHMEDERLNEMGLPPVYVHLRNLEKINGLTRASHSNKPHMSHTYMSRHDRHQKSSGSESGSSTPSHSPPETPGLTHPAAGGPGRPIHPSSPQIQYLHQFPRGVYTTPFPQYGPNYAQFPANGEAPMYNSPFASPYVTVPIYNPPPKQSCWNCGSVGHLGNECKETSIEEVTRSGGYQLDFSTAPPDINDK